MKLSKRLNMIKSYVPDKAILADICCDHAQIPITLLLEKKIPFAIASDLRREPIKAAENFSKKSGLDSTQISFRIGDGFETLSPNEAEVFILSGIGSELMIEILRRGKNVTQEAYRLILSPNRKPWFLREWLSNEAFCIIDEALIYEKRHFYEIVVIESGAANPLSEFEIYFGQYLHSYKGNEIKMYYSMRYEHDMKLIEMLKSNTTVSMQDKRRIQNIKFLWGRWVELYGVPSQRYR